jgi:hypothetical protein
VEHLSRADCVARGKDAWAVAPLESHAEFSPGPGRDPHSPVTGAVRSLEARWIFPGLLETAVASWFSRFPATTESREDTYLLDPPMRGLSVKVRAGAALEVKVYRGSRGILQVPGRARGRLEAWQKWSFPFSALRLDSAGPAGWQPVRKRRRISRFPLASGPAAARAPVPGGEPQCAVELTEVRTRGQDWWTLGFEATGPAGLLHSELQATAALVFAQPLPAGVEPGPDYSRSYAAWLGRPPGAESDVDT